MRHIDLVTTAKLVRETLKTAFPRTKFSVRSKSYSGGCSITAHWTDGPTGKQVKTLLDRFEGKGFDGMTDCSYYCGERMYKGERVDFCGAYVFEARTISAEIARKVADRVAYECGVATPEVNEYGVSRSGDEHQVPFAWFSHWHRDEAGNETPLTLAHIEGPEPILAHDSHKGEWLSNLINSICCSLSLEAQQPVDLPEYIDKEAMFEGHV
jgi:hypothetical protein